MANAKKSKGAVKRNSKQLWKDKVEANDKLIAKARKLSNEVYGKNDEEHRAKAEARVKGKAIEKRLAKKKKKAPVKKKKKK